MDAINNDRQKFIKHFLAIAPKHCDNCGFKYSEADFKVIKSTAQGIVLHLSCQNCKNTYVLNVMNPVNGMVGTQRAPLNLDLASDVELQEFAGKDAVAKNDALDVYHLLDNKLEQKDMEELLKR